MYPLLTVLMNHREVSLIEYLDQE